MQYTNNLNLSLPSSDNAEDLADINVISNNFQKIDDFVENIYSGINEISALVGGAE